jgi:hypothetical protein
MKLKELLAGGRTAQAAQHAELAVVYVGDVGAAVLACRLGIEVDDRGEKPCRKLIINVLRWNHKNFLALTD